MTGAPEPPGPAPRERERPLAGAVAAAVVALRWPVIIAWIALAVVLTLRLPSIVDGGGDAAPPIPTDIPAVAAERAAYEEFGATLVSRVLVVQHDRAGVGAVAADRAAALAAEASSGALRRDTGVVAAFPVPDAGVAGGRPPTTILTHLLVEPDRSVAGQVRAAQDYAARLGPEAAVVGVTGATAAWHEEATAIEDALPLITALTVAVVVVVLGLAFRSVVAPVVALAAVGVAYVVGVRLIGYAGEQAGYPIPRQAEPIVVALLFAVVTDYAAFHMFRMRQFLAEGAAPRDAVLRAATSTMPVVGAATLTVAAGTATLLLGSLELFRAFAPALVVTALVAGAVSVTLVPALLAVLGRGVFWPRPHDARPPRHRARRLMAAPAAAVPTILVVLAGLAALAVAGLPDARLDFAGPLSAPAGSETRRAADAAVEDLPAGILAPVQVVVRGDGVGGDASRVAALQDRLGREPGIAAVFGPATPGASALPAGVVTAPRPGAVRLVAILAANPYGPDGIEAVDALERRLPAVLRDAGLPQARAELSGDPAVAAQTVDRIRADLLRTGLACLVVVGLVLVLLLRALVAPLLVIATTVLGLAATLAATALVMNALGLGDGLAYYVPLAASILLISLGSDYAMFLVARIWDRGHVRLGREAVARATAESSTAISVAGVVLAASFALLALIPVAGLQQFALAMTIGILLDAFVVRGLLVPAVLALLGERARWPARRPAAAQ